MAESINTQSIKINKTKILYIGGWGRSGSTILGRILGQADGFFLAGETRFFWDRGLQKNWKCGCGQNFSECSLWNKVVKITNFSTQTIMETTQQINKLKAKNILLGLNTPHNMIGLVNHLNTLYTTIASISGARVIVDTSKHPAYAWWLSRTQNIDFHLIHLIRDPRGTANSWNKPPMDARGDGTPSMAKYSLFYNTRQWIVWNLLYEQLKPKFDKRYMRIKYEDFIVAPQHTINSIFNFLDEPKQILVDENNHIMLNANHTISGNYNRFDTGLVRLQKDGQWQTKLSKLDKLAIAMFSFPLLKKYNYSIFS